MLSFKQFISEQVLDKDLRNSDDKKFAVSLSHSSKKHMKFHPIGTSSFNKDAKNESIY